MTFEIPWWNYEGEKIVDGTIVKVRAVRCTPRYDIIKDDDKKKVTLPTHGMLLQLLIEAEARSGDRVSITYIGMTKGRTKPYHTYQVQIWRDERLVSDNKEKIKKLMRGKL